MHLCSMNGINKRGYQEKLGHLESLVASLAKTTGCPTKHAGAVTVKELQGPLRGPIND